MQRKKAWFYTQVSLCFKQAKKDWGWIKWSWCSPLTRQVAAWSAECVLGETMPLMRVLLNLGEMTAIHLSDSQQSCRGGGGATFPKHDWLMSDVECKLIYSSLLCLERGGKRQSEDLDQGRQKEIIACPVATALGVIKLSSLVWLHLQLIAANHPRNLTRVG